tara:strand:- start:212 stop:358 length:147 start_codon:yes stop_codon:yes gene_type:complete
MKNALSVSTTAKEKHAHSSVGIHFIPNAYLLGLKKITIALVVVLKFQK